MGNGQAVAGVDRLPWLADEGEAAARRRRPAAALVWAVPLLLLVVAAASYWLGANSERLFERPEFRLAADPAATISVPLPEPLGDRGPPPMVEPLPEPAMPAIAEPATAASRAVAAAPARPRPASKHRRPNPHSKPKPKARSQDRSRAKPSSPEPWPVRVIEGSSGRLVRIGAFSSRAQAKRGWRALMRVNPWLQRLPALVVRARPRATGKPITACRWERLRKRTAWLCAKGCG